jgi:hypothetical protein
MASTTDTERVHMTPIFLNSLISQSLSIRDQAPPA